MLLELAVGDAYGAGFEYVNRKGCRRPQEARYVQHPRHRETKPGMYTDDTQMSLAIAELIVAEADWTPFTIASKFVEVFHRDPRQGYASRFYAFLLETTSGEEFLARIRPHSTKSGAAMRAAPLGVLPDRTEVIEKCRVQAAVTHHTEIGIHSATAAALMAHYFLYHLGKKEQLGRWLERHVPGPWSRDYVGVVKSQGWMSVQAAVTAVRHSTSLAGLLQACVNFGGDVDTVAAIALGAAAGCEEITKDLPAQLVNGLESGRYGKDSLIALDRQLLARIGPS